MACWHGATRCRRLSLFCGRSTARAKSRWPHSRWAARCRYQKTWRSVARATPCNSIHVTVRDRMYSMHWCGAWIASTRATRINARINTRIGARINARLEAKIAPRLNARIEAMKVGIYGAGAIGGWMGVKLAQAGHDVSVVARGATLSELQQHGLRLIEGGVTHTVKVTASEQPADLGVQDLVVVAVKGPGMASVAAHIAPLLGPQTIVLTAMNGVPWWFCDGLGRDFAGKRLKSIDPDGAIAAAIPTAQTVGCVVHA